MNLRRVGVDIDLHFQFQPVGQHALERIRAAGVHQMCLGQLANVVDHAPLGIVEPLAHEGLDRVLAVLFAERLEPALGDAGRAQPGEIVAVPLVGHPDACPAHAHDVLDILEVALDAHAREDQCAFLVNVACPHEIAGRDRVSDVGHVAFRDGGEQVLVLPEDRHHEGVIGRVRVAAIGVVVEVGVAAPDVAGMILAHVGGLDVAAEDVHRQAFGRREQFVLSRHQAAGEIPRRRDHGRTGRTQQGVGHLADDTVEAVRHHRDQDGVERGLWFGHGVFPSQRQSRM